MAKADVDSTHTHIHKIVSMFTAFVVVFWDVKKGDFDIHLCIVRCWNLFQQNECNYRINVHVCAREPAIHMPWIREKREVGGRSIPSHNMNGWFCSEYLTRTLVSIVDLVDFHAGTRSRHELMLMPKVAASMRVARLRLWYGLHKQATMQSLSMQSCKPYRCFGCMWSAMGRNGWYVYQRIFGNLWSKSGASQGIWMHPTSSD